jgi:hypothetical protein
MKDFMEKFNPEKQDEYSKYPSACVTDKKVPTLIGLDKTFGPGSAKMWLIPEIVDLNDRCGAKEKMTQQQIDACASAISTLYPYNTLRLTELMLYFFMLKGGSFGRFYGSIDPQFVTEKIGEFWKKVHVKEWAKYEEQKFKEKRQIEWERREKYAVSYEQYLEIKHKAESGDEEAKKLLNGP